MNYITSEDVYHIAEKLGGDIFEKWPSRDVKAVCNAAIQHYIDSQPVPERPVYGKPGTRDVDVAEAMKQWDGKHAAQEPEQRGDIEELVGRYWEIAYSEGKTGVSRGTEAQEVLSAIRDAARVSQQPGDV